MTKRTISVYGLTPTNTNLEFTVDGVEHRSIVDHALHSPDLSDHHLIFSFETDTQFHGWANVKLRASQDILIGRSMVTYEAVWIDQYQQEHWGHLTGMQPLFDPKFLVQFDGKLYQRDEQDKDLTGEWLYELPAGVCMNYYHLLHGAFDAFYLFLDDYPTLQTQWIDTKSIFLQEWQDLPWHGIVRRLYRLLPFSADQYHDLQQLALSDFKSRRH